MCIYINKYMRGEDDYEDDDDDDASDDDSDGGGGGGDDDGDYNDDEYIHDDGGGCDDDIYHRRLLRPGSGGRTSRTAPCSGCMYLLKLRWPSQRHWLRPTIASEERSV